MICPFARQIAGQKLFASLQYPSLHVTRLNANLSGENNTESWSRSRMPLILIASRMVHHQQTIRGYLRGREISRRRGGRKAPRRERPCVVGEVRFTVDVVNNTYGFHGKFPFV